MQKEKTLSDEIFNLTRKPEVRNEDADIILAKKVKEFIKKIESDILDLSILEINKDLTIPELVEKAIDKIREEAGGKLI